jgi:capsular polysaccharide transport system ATP-binding protein
MLEFFEVWKGFKKGSRQRWILSGASVAVPRGRRVALLGAEGAGKSSVIRLMCGLDAPDGGVVRRTGIACWPLSHSTFLETNGTLLQNARFLGQIYGADPDDMVRIASEISGVKVSRARRIKEYTPIERKQLALGITLSVQFDWYFIDGALPPVSREDATRIDGAIADRLSRGTVVWATRDATTVAGYCDAGIVLDRGALLFYNDFAEAADVYRHMKQPKVARK